MISRVKLEEGNTEFWKHRFLGESYNDVPDKDIESEDPNSPDMLDEVDAVEDVTVETEEDEVDEEEEVVEQTESQAGDLIKDKAVERAKPLQMIGVQLLKDSDETTTSRKARRKATRASIEVCSSTTLLSLPYVIGCCLSFVLNVFTFLVL